ncbi:hypothetical protein TNCV_974791 [Trichonephila clavipes]|nr:hypothetical protein TNCV_974791 [Trichonephila clavipes]
MMMCEFCFETQVSHAITSPKLPKHHGKRQFLSIQDCWKQHMFSSPRHVTSSTSTTYDGPFKKCKPAFFFNTEDLQLPQTKNETPATVESDPTASTPTQPSTRSGRKVHLPTRYR